jgi:uncharacterized protein (DUF1697 family)
MRYVAFLRGMNLGKRRPPMSKLRSLFEELGFRNVETFIASGNVIFSTGSSSSRQIGLRIARHLESSLGYPVDTFVRTADEVAKIAGTKILSESEAPGTTVHVAFLHEKLSPGVARELQSVDTGYDRFRVKDGEFYWFCCGPISKSEVWKLPEVKKLKLPACTMRNITSLRKLVAKHIVSAGTPGKDE